MSWGERSCKHKPCIIPDECTMGTCNVNCRCYEWDGKTELDSKSENNSLKNYVLPKWKQPYIKNKQKEV
jgi:hypothetical protein